MKRRKKPVVRIAGIMIAAALLAGSVPVPMAVTNAAALSTSGNTEELISCSYMYQGEEKTLYLYSKDGKSFMSGDVMISTGNPSGYWCREVTGYIEVPFEVSQASMVCREYEESGDIDITGSSYSLFALDKHGYLHYFYPAGNADEYGWNDVTWNQYVDLNGHYILDNNGNLYDLTNMYPESGDYGLSDSLSDVASYSLIAQSDKKGYYYDYEEAASYAIRTDEFDYVKVNFVDGSSEIYSSSNKGFERIAYIMAEVISDSKIRLEGTMFQRDIAIYDSANDATAYLDLLTDISTDSGYLVYEYNGVSIKAKKGSTFDSNGLLDEIVVEGATLSFHDQILYADNLEISFAAASTRNASRKSWKVDTASMEDKYSYKYGNASGIVSYGGRAVSKNQDVVLYNNHTSGTLEFRMSGDSFLVDMVSGTAVYNNLSYNSVTEVNEDGTILFDMQAFSDENNLYLSDLTPFTMTYDETQDLLTVRISMNSRLENMRATVSYSGKTTSRDMTTPFNQLSSYCGNRINKLVCELDTYMDDEESYQSDISFDFGQDIEDVSAIYTMFCVNPFTNGSLVCNTVEKVTSDGCYSIDDNGVLYETSYNDLYDQHMFPLEFGYKKVAENVVAVNSKGYYLDTANSIYDKNDNLLVTNAEGLYDGVYKKGGSYFSINDLSKELIFDRPDASNIIVNVYSADDGVFIELTYDAADFTCITAPEGCEESTENTYLVKKNGVYTFQTINKYGETDELNVFVSLIEDNGINAPVVTVTDGMISLSSSEGNKLFTSEDQNDWLLYDKPFLYKNTFFVKAVSENLMSSAIYQVTVEENGRTEVNNVSDFYLPVSQFAGEGYLVDNRLYSLEQNYIGSYIPNGLAAVYSHSENEGYSDYVYKNNYGVSTGDYNADHPRIINSLVLKHENVNSIVKILLDESYAYLIDANGTLARADRSLMSAYGGCSSTNYYGWKNEWLDENVTSVDEVKGIIKTKSGNEYHYLTSSLVATDVEDLKYYLEDDITTYGGGTITENVPESPNTIISVKVTDYGYTALDDKGNIYRYDQSLDAMVSCVQVAGKGYNVDFAIDNTNWTNTGVEITAEKGIYSQDYNLWDEMCSQTVEGYPDLIKLSAMEEFYEDVDDRIIKTYTFDEPTTFEYDVMGVCYQRSPENRNQYMPNIFMVKENGEVVSGAVITDETGRTVTIYFGDANTVIASMKLHVKYVLPAGTYVMKSYNAPETYVGYSKDYSLGKNLVIGGETVSLKEYTSQNVYELKDKEGNVIPFTENDDGTYSAKLTENGTYDLLAHYHALDGRVVKTETISIGNIDTVMPKVSVAAIENGVLMYEAEDVAGGNSAVSGIKAVYYSTDDGANYTMLQDGQKIRYERPAEELLMTTLLSGGVDNSIVPVSQATILLQAEDKAGNRSAVIEVDLRGNIELHDEITYENGKTTYSYFADSDSDHTDNAYTYYLTDLADGQKKQAYTEVYTSDTSVLAAAEKQERGITVRGTKKTDIIVAKTETPTIEDKTGKVAVSAGEFHNASLRALYVSIDGAAYEKVADGYTKDLNTGTHKVKAYQTILVTGTDVILKSDVAELDITVKEAELPETPPADPEDSKDQPEDPKVPDEPEAPETPKEPDKPAEPEIPKEPDKPTDPEVPGKNDTPEVIPPQENVPESGTPQEATPPEQQITTPQTGDTSPLSVWLLLAGTAGAMVLFGLKSKKTE